MIKKKSFWRNIWCWLGHDPKFAMAVTEGDRYIVTYVCDCGKSLKVDETHHNIPYAVVAHRFRKEAR